MRQPYKFLQYVTLSFFGKPARSAGTPIRPVKLNRQVEGTATTRAIRLVRLCGRHVVAGHYLVALG